MEREEDGERGRRREREITREGDGEMKMKKERPPVVQRKWFSWSSFYLHTIIFSPYTVLTQFVNDV